MFSILTLWFFLSSGSVSHFVWDCCSEMMASAKEAAEVILVVNGESLTYKPFQKRNLTFGAQAPMLGDSIFHH